MLEKDLTLADVESAILRAMSELSERLGGRLHQLEIKIETLASNQQAWQQTTVFRLDELSRRIGNNEGAIKGCMDFADHSSNKAREAERALRIDFETLRKDVERERAKEEGGKDAITRLRNTIAWVGGVVSVMLGVVAYLQAS